MAKQNIPVVSPGDALAAIAAGRRGYYIDRGDFWDVVIVDDPICTANFMQAWAFATYPADVTRYFDQKQSQRFETEFMPKMLRSTLSDEPGGSHAPTNPPRGDGDVCGRIRQSEPADGGGPSPSQPA